MPEGALKELTQALERVKAQIRVRVEHAFHVVKNLFKHKKARQEGPLQGAGQERRADVQPVRPGQSGDRQETIDGVTSQRCVLKGAIVPEKAKTGPSSPWN